MNLAESYSTFYSNRRGRHSTQSLLETYHILEHKASNKKYRTSDIIPCTLSKLNGINAECKVHELEKLYKLMGTKQHTTK